MSSAVRKLAFSASGAKVTNAIVIEKVSHFGNRALLK